MKNILFVLIMIAASGLVYSVSSSGKIKPDNIKGIWWNEEKTTKVRIYKAVNEKYYGKVHWLKKTHDENGNPRTDINNPDDDQKKKPLLGLMVLKGFEWDEDDQEWDNGTIYDPTSGSTYSCYGRIEKNKPNTLFLRGYIIGMPFLGRTSEWERVDH